MKRARGVALLAIAMASLAAGCRRAVDDPAAHGRTAAWLDLSPSYGDPPRDPGDALALLQAYGSARLSVRGVSVTFGNVPLERGFPVAQELMTRLEASLLRPWRGPSSAEERAAPTEATELLTDALRKQAMTIVALGPATTVASVLLREPALTTRIERVVLVGGLPEDSAGRGATAADPNVVADAGSLRVLLDSPLPITLVPAGTATGVALDAADLDRVPSARGALSLVIPSARAWLRDVAAAGGRTSFPVPAMLAVDVVAHHGEVRCDVATARLRSDAAGTPELVVSAAPGGGRRVTWCHSADANAKARILADLAQAR